MIATKPTVVATIALAVVLVAGATPVGTVAADTAAVHTR